MNRALDQEMVGLRLHGANSGKARRIIQRLAPLLLLSATACTTWVKPGAGPAELDRATTRCTAASHMMVEADYVEERSYGASYNQRSKCEKNSSQGCVWRKGKWYSVYDSTRDLNSSARDSVFRDCMYDDGWRMK